MDLPFDVDEAAEAEAEAQTFSVLVVDDEAVVRDVMARLLAREKDLVITLAEDAEQAVELIRNQRFELLITDKNLPGMGGIELIAEARALRPTLEAIMITGYASAESVIGAIAAGASDYLVKPFDDLKLVRAKVRAALDRRSQQLKNKDRSRQLAKEAAVLLARGRDAPEPEWQALEAAFRHHEQAMRGAVRGAVAVVGGEEPTRVLEEAGFRVSRVLANSPLVRVADVVVIETGNGEDWRPLAEQVLGSQSDIVLVAGPDADLPDLLEALSLRIDLVGFGGKSPAKLLPDKVRATLIYRTGERAKRELASALARFRLSLTLPASG